MKMMNMMMKMMMLMMEKWCFDQTGTNLCSEYDEHDVENGLEMQRSYDANCW